MPTPPTNSQQPLPLRLRLRSVNSLAVRFAHSVFKQQAVPLIPQTHLVTTIYPLDITTVSLLLSAYVCCLP